MYRPFSTLLDWYTLGYYGVKRTTRKCAQERIRLIQTRRGTDDRTQSQLGINVDDRGQGRGRERVRYAVTILFVAHVMLKNVA